MNHSHLSCASDVLSPSTLLASLNWRYAVKKFDVDKTIPSEVWSALEQSLVLTPSSFGLQPWKFLVLTDRELRAQLVPIAWNQAQVVESSHLVVFLAKTQIESGDIEKFIQRIAHVRGQSRESLEGYFGVMENFRAKMTPESLLTWAQKQVYIAQGQLMLSAALLGVDTCPMEGFDSAKVTAWIHEKLGFEDYTATLLLPCGYRASDDKYASSAKVRFELDEVIARY